MALWKHFATAYSDEYPWTGDVHVAVPITETEVLFDLIPGAIGSPGGLFLTSLSLVSKESNRPDPGFDRETFETDEPSTEISRGQWVQLATLDNLAVLKIHGSYGGSLVDQVVRAWAHRSVLAGALSRLQVLGLIDQDSLSLASLLELIKISSLAVVQWSGKAITSAKSFEGYGWKLGEDNAFEEEQNLGRPLLKVRFGPKPSPDGMLKVTLVPDPEWKSKNKRKAHEEDMAPGIPAPPKRPNMRKGAKKDAASLLDQISGR